MNNKRKQYKIADLPERYAKNITVNSKGCWVYDGHSSTNGYMRLWYLGKRVMAHKYVLEYFTSSSIPRGLVVDHICENRACVNPAHLDIVTQSENCKRKFNRKVKI